MEAVLRDHPGRTWKTFKRARACDLIGAPARLAATNSVVFTATRMAQQKGNKVTLEYPRRSEVVWLNQPARRVNASRQESPASTLNPKVEGCEPVTSRAEIGLSALEVAPGSRASAKQGHERTHATLESGLGQRNLRTGLEPRRPS